jgi:hypothetical protein
MIKLKDILEEACWKGYKQIGMKKKGKKSVPNCVPIEEAAIDINAEFNAELIDRINDEYREDYKSLTPGEINDGYCDQWALLFVEKFGGKHQWTFDIPNDPNGHSWVKLNNKFYDAEVPKGVSKLEEIPYIQRAIARLKSSEWLDDSFYKNIQS